MPRSSPYSQAVPIAGGVTFDFAEGELKAPLSQTAVGRFRGRGALSGEFVRVDENPHALRHEGKARCQPMGFELLSLKET